MPFVLAFTAHPALEVPKTPVWPMFSCMREGGGGGWGGKLEGDFPLLNSADNMCHLLLPTGFRVAGPVRVRVPGPGFLGGGGGVPRHYLDEKKTLCQLLCNQR